MVNYPLRLAIALTALLCGQGASATEKAGAISPEPTASEPGPALNAHHKFHLELALFPMMTVQQIEGPARDDLITQESGLSTAFNFGFAPIEYIEPAIWVQFDTGRTRRAVFTRTNAEGVATEEQLVEGSFWELWTVLMLRGRYGPGFVELGYAPLILRNDDIRTDLANTDGNNTATLEGSRSVAFMLAGGGSIPVWDNFDITLRMQFRIRYLVSRGGKPLVDGEENGQMTVWPFVGAHYHF